jgi:hypothetical protein
MVPVTVRKSSHLPPAQADVFLYDPALCWTYGTETNFILQERKEELIFVQFQLWAVSNYERRKSEAYSP